MSGYIVVLTVFTIYLLPDSYALFAKFANRVLRCPNPNNITEWEQASTKLACLHPLRGGSSDQLARVYHCLPSNFLNESVEYCGYSGPVTKGNCPVYKYGDGRNRAASYRSCANFTSGCPEKQYHSKDVYNYPACLNINTVDKCYVAEPMCEKSYESVIDHTQISSTESDVMIVVIVILLVIIFGLVASFILREKKIIPCSTNKDKRENNTDRLLQDHENTEPKETLSNPSQQNGSIGQQQVHYNAENRSVHMETDTPENNEGPLLQDHENTIPKEAFYDPSQQHQVDYNATSQSADDAETDAPDDDILDMPFNIFLGEVGREISREALIKLKDHLEASEKKMEKKKIEEIATGSEAINLMHQKYDFNINLYLLQSILELIGEEQLAERCINFGKTYRKLYYYKGHVNIKGYREIVLKVNKNIADYHREDLERMKKRLLRLLSGPEPNAIVIKTIAEGCIAIHALVRQNVVNMIKSADLSSLREDCVVEVIVGGECLRIAEKDVSLSCFEVSFDYGPTALATHKQVADKLQQHRKLMGLVDVRYDSVIIVHHTEKDLYDIVLELFESQPIIHGKKKYSCVKDVDDVGNLVIFCCDKLSQKIVYQSLTDTALGEDCKENHFIFSMEKIEETDLDYSALLQTKMDTEHILQPKSDKSHLYNAYCACVEEKFKLFKKMIWNSKLKKNTRFPEIFSSLEKLEEMLDSHSLKQQTSPAGNVAKNYLREIESIMMDNMPRLSKAVYVGLCREVGTATEVRIRRDVVDTEEAVKRPMRGLHSMTSGNQREGFRLGTSDTDCMFWPPNHKVICDLSQVSLYCTPQHSVILMEWEDLPPGFTRLKLLTESYSTRVRSLCVNRNGEQYISNELFKRAFSNISLTVIPAVKCEQHEPCTSFVFGDSLEIDEDFCLASQHWPTLALPWIERCRQTQWPPDDVLHDIVKSGFHVVPIGSDHTKDDEWRISFSKAEQKLVYSMNHTQFLCYGLLKIFLKEVINAQLSDPILCSYFMKTILFWVIQQYASLTWMPSDLLSFFWICFKFLVGGIHKGECPNFFIPQNNMFRVKVVGATQSLLFDQVYNLYCKGISCLLLSPTLRPYLNKAILNKIPEVRTDEDSIISTVRLDMRFFNEIYMLSFPIPDVQSFAVYMREIEILLKRRQTPYQLVCIQKTTSDVLISTAWHLAQYTEPCNKVVKGVSDAVCHMLKIALKIGYVSDILYLAMYYYRIGRHKQSLGCLQSAQERMSVPYVIYHDNVNVEMYRRAMTGVSLSEKMRKAVVTDIKLLESYTYINELSLEQSVSKNNGKPILHIPPLVMLHMLRVLNHHRLGHTLESHQALQKLQTLLLRDDGVCVPVHLRDISYQILGICQHVCGEYVGALNSYQYSLEQDPYHRIQQASTYRIHVHRVSINK